MNILERLFGKVCPGCRRKRLGVKMVSYHVAREHVPFSCDVADQKITACSECHKRHARAWWDVHMFHAAVQRGKEWASFQKRMERRANENWQKERAQLIDIITQGEGV